MATTGHCDLATTSHCDLATVSHCDLATTGYCGLMRYPFYDPKNAVTLATISYKIFMQVNAVNKVLVSVIKLLRNNGGRNLVKRSEEGRRQLGQGILDGPIPSLPQHKGQK